MKRSFLQTPKLDVVASKGKFFQTGGDWVTKNDNCYRLVNLQVPADSYYRSSETHRETQSFGGNKHTIDSGFSTIRPSRLVCFKNSKKQLSGLHPKVSLDSLVEKLESKYTRPKSQSSLSISIRQPQKSDIRVKRKNRAQLRSISDMHVESENCIR
jgi:hypothetical protein